MFLSFKHKKHKVSIVILCTYRNIEDHHVKQNTSYMRKIELISISSVSMWPRRTSNELSNALWKSHENSLKNSFIRSSLMYHYTVDQDTIHFCIVYEITSMRDSLFYPLKISSSLHFVCLECSNYGRCIFQVFSLKSHLILSRCFLTIINKGVCEAHVVRHGNVNGTIIQWGPLSD